VLPPVDVGGADDASTTLDWGSTAALELGSVAGLQSMPGDAVPSDCQTAADQLVMQYGKNNAVLAVAYSQAHLQQGIPVDAPNTPPPVYRRGTPPSSRLKVEHVDLLPETIIRDIVQNTGTPPAPPGDPFPPLSQTTFLSEVSCPIDLCSCPLLVLHVFQF
jgi:hypothetical protein